MTSGTPVARDQEVIMLRDAGELGRGAVLHSVAFEGLRVDVASIFDAD